MERLSAQAAVLVAISFLYILLSRNGDRPSSPVRFRLWLWFSALGSDAGFFNLKHLRKLDRLTLVGIESAANIGMKTIPTLFPGILNHFMLANRHADFAPSANNQTPQPTYVHFDLVSLAVQDRGEFRGGEFSSFLT
jgi:hypothetical protein